ncbi:MAG: response regulator [Coleofasciculaceae cyanobacterium]
MKGHRHPLTILMADDDPDDCMLAHEALGELHKSHDLRFVGDGEELLDYLYHRGKYTQRESAPRPALILLDLNMPKKDGREALKQIKSDPQLRNIPILVLTTSRAEEDIHHSYHLGANSFITKPVTFSSLVELMKTLSKYWFEIVELPQEEAGDLDGQPPTQSSARR